MKRNVSLDEISDGRLLGHEDMARLGSGDCAGCSACCRDMGRSIILDPMDIFRLNKALNTTFEQLLSDKIQLNVVDGIILPNLKMDETTNACGFLNDRGRCSIHHARPGICRIFPLGRYYDGEGFKYFLQIYECKKENRTKIKVKKWVDTPDLKTYDQYICCWHYFLIDLEKVIENSRDDLLMKKIDMFVLELFYLTPYDPDKDFYEQFYQRMETAKKFRSSLPLK